MKDIKYYLHLYLGCEVWYDDKKYYLESVERYSLTYGERKGCFIMIDADDCLWLAPNDVKPILRKLSSMTKEDVALWGDVNVNPTPYCVELDSKDEFGEFTEVYPDGSILSRSKDDGESRAINGGELFILLLSKGFDLFGLIESGLAIDKDTLKD